MSEEYQCPLCCGEKFDSREALRYHLLSMSVNLNCPKCNLLCENGFSQLADHLAKDCGEEQDEDDMNEETLEQETLESGPEEEILKNMKQDPHSNENSQEATEAAAEIEDVEMLNDTLNENNAVVTLEDGSTIMVTAIDAEEQAEQILGDAGSVEAEGEEGEIYSCSSCGVNFTSIMEHIERYHDGQEVVVEVRFKLISPDLRRSIKLLECYKPTSCKYIMSDSQASVKVLRSNTIELNLVWHYMTTYSGNRNRYPRERIRL